MKWISFHMNEQTERSAVLLAKSLDKLGLSHDFESVPDQGSFAANRQHVPSWILWKLLEDSSQPVVWINPTATIMADPVLLKEPIGDFAVFTMGNAFWAKTLYVKNSDKAREVLRRWANLNLEYAWKVSCENFTQAINEIKPVMTLLPPSYSWIEETFPKTYGKLNPVIQHPLGGL